MTRSISAGGLSGILNVLLALVGPGDEVVLTDPIYVGLLNRVRVASAIPRSVPLVAERAGWRLERESLAAAVGPATRMLLLMSPSMPSGHVLDRDDWAFIAELCRSHDLLLLYDAAMERILFDDRPLLSPLAVPGLGERTIVVGSASKELRMIGWRVGWIVAPPELIPDIGFVAISNVVCQTGIAQDAVAVALEAGDEDVAAATAELERRRDVLLEELGDLPVVPPGGGWSLLLDVAALGHEATAASELLFTQAKIAATPMIGWGEHAAGYLRFVYANEPIDRLRGIGARVRDTLGTQH